MTCPRSRRERWPPRRSTQPSSCPGSTRPCGKTCRIAALPAKTRHGHVYHVPIPVTSSRMEAVDGLGGTSNHTTTGSGVPFSARRWGLVLPPNPFPEQEGFADALARLGPARAEPVTNTSWFAACLPGAGASVWIADSPQRLPPLPLQLPYEYFPFSHYFNCPCLRKLPRTGSVLKRPVTHGCPNRASPRRGRWGDGGVGHPPPWHTRGTFVPWPCRDPGHAGRVIGSEFSTAPSAAHVERGARAAGGVRMPAPAQLNVT